MLQFAIFWVSLMQIIAFPPVKVVALVVTLLNPAAHFTQSLSPVLPLAEVAAVVAY